VVEIHLIEVVCWSCFLFHTLIAEMKFEREMRELILASAAQASTSRCLRFEKEMSAELMEVPFVEVAGFESSCRCRTSDSGYTANGAPAWLKCRSVYFWVSLFDLLFTCDDLCHQF
jgi:hypothetical protein